MPKPTFTKKYIRMNKLVLFSFIAAFTFNACKQSEVTEVVDEVIENVDTLKYEQEIHLKNLQQLTFGGDNAEAYWSFDGKSLVFQRKHEPSGVMCDQIFIGKVPSTGEDFVFDFICF